MRAAIAGLLAGVSLFSAAWAADTLPEAASPQTVRPAEAPVTKVVRNELGQIRWVKGEATGYTDIEAEGRRLYLGSGCTYCHSQHVRPVTAETRPWGTITTDARRWGPVSEPGEYAFDIPTSFGTRGIAPDLAREGLKYGDEWHLAHFWQPPMITPGSIMGGFSGLFHNVREPVGIVDGPSGKTLARTPETEALFSFDSDRQVKLTPNPDGVLFVPLEGRGLYPLIWTPNEEYSGETVQVVAESKEIQALTAYVQKLGTNRGLWRDAFEPDQVEGASLELPRSDEWIAHGKLVYERNCIACHGEKGDGNGPAATFLHQQRPRNFTLGVFKFRSTKGTLPTDADLLRTITRGVHGTAMPAWFELPLQDRLAVIQYIKYVLAADTSDPQNPYLYFVEEPPGPPIAIGAPPEPSADLVSHGRDVWTQAKCWECHGQTGKGDGEKAAGLTDDWGFPIIPANLTRGLFKSGPTVSDIFRTISNGLSGSPMPSFRNAFPDQDRWALSYYILSLSAFTDPLTGNRLPISDHDRAALNDPKLRTTGPDRAYGPLQDCGDAACAGSGMALTSAAGDVK